MNDRIRVTFEGSVATVTLNRPAQHNGVDFPMLEEMLAVQRTLRRNRQIRAVILRGEGPSFCAGLDFKAALKQPVRALWKASQLLWPWANQFQRWSMGWRKVGVPVIAVMHGNCFGAGLQLGLGADIRLCHEGARLSFMEAKLGLVPDMGGICLLRELAPIDVAKELVFTGRIISAPEALAAGLVTRVSADPMAEALALAEEIATRSPDSVAAGKGLIQQAWRVGDVWALRAERLWQRRIIGRANQKVAFAKSKAKGGGEEGPSFRPRSV
jgi:enoyl-CoA hydratase/carnithine racemase